MKRSAELLNSWILLTPRIQVLRIIETLRSSVADSSSRFQEGNALLEEEGYDKG